MNVAPAFNSYNIVVSHRSEANLTDEQKAELARNERHLGLKMAIPEGVAEGTA